MAARGATPLSAKQIFDLVSGNTLYLESLDFNSHMYFQPDGNITAKAESLTGDDTDTGGWDINGENQLCLKFRVWQYGEMRCYALYPEGKKNKYVFFTSNGAIAYNARSFSGDSAHLYKTGKSNQKETYLRESFVTDQTAADSTAVAVPVPAADPDKKYTYLRESMAGDGAGTASQEEDQSATSEQKNAAAPGASDAEVEHTVKVMAKNCPGCNLEKSDLRQADLVGANLKGADLKGADLSRANLRRANLQGADLKGAILLNANLPGANLQGADLTAADFTGANLLKADFTGAKTGNMILTNAHLEGVKGLK
jgi:hypothetical protein